jgi:tetratricopeptide (TPR) repeat protein
MSMDPKRSSLVRKLVYLALAATLLIPLFVIGRPAVVQEEGKTTGGGILAEMRQREGIAQSELGDVDPASSAMRLASMGLHGVAVAVLQSQANQAKIDQDFDEMTALNNQILRLQPNFVKVWDFQAHNMSYNTSVEFDDYRQRYTWVKKGIDFLMEGERYNRDDPLILKDLGWYMGQKVGRADEHKQFRRLFRKDDQFVQTFPAYIDINRAYTRYGYDNWLMAGLWYDRSVSAVDERGKRLYGDGPLIFYRNPAMSKMNHAEALEDDFRPDEVAQTAWENAETAWRGFGDRPVNSSWGEALRLNQLEQIRVQVAELERKLDQFAPGVRERITEERKKQLDPLFVAAVETPPEERTQAQVERVNAAAPVLDVDPKLIFAEIPSDKRTGEAVRLTDRIAKLKQYATYVDRYRNQVAFDYWMGRARMEATADAIAARNFLLDAKENFQAGRLEEAKTDFERGFALWKKLLTAYPVTLESSMTDDLTDSIALYGRTLDNLGETFPKPFDLQMVIDRQTGGGVEPAEPPAESPDEST